jgi:hypothetical protein
MFPSQLPQLLTDYAAIFTQCYIRYLEQLSLLYLSRNVRIRRSCGENLSKRPSVKGHNSSKSSNRKILTCFLCRHHHLALCQVSSKSFGKWDNKSVHRQTHTHTDKLLTNQDKHPNFFRKFNKQYIFHWLDTFIIKNRFFFCFKIPLSMCN